jgi:hypothetical protein
MTDELKVSPPVSVEETAAVPDMVEARIEATTPVDPLDVEFDKAIQMIANDPYLTQKHLAALVGALGGRRSLGNQLLLLDELKKVGAANKEKLIRIAESIAREYLTHGGFQVTWYRFMKPITADAALLEAFKSRYGLTMLPKHIGGRKPYPCQLGKSGANSVGLLFAVPHVNNSYIDGNGERQVHTSLQYVPVVVRPGGVEVRASGEAARKVGDFLFEVLAEMGFSVGKRGNPAAIRDTDAYRKLVKDLKARVLDYNGKDDKGSTKTKGRRAHDAANEPPERRDLQAIAETDPEVKELLELDWQSAEIEFDFVHDNIGYTERVCIGLKHGYIKVHGRTTESALSHFWSKLAGVLS